METLPLPAATGRQPGRHPARAALAIGILAAGVLVLLVFLLRQTNTPRRIGSLALIQVPGAGAVWLELDDHQPARPLAVNPLNSNLEAVPIDGGTPGAWSIEARHAIRDGSNGATSNPKPIIFLPIPTPTSSPHADSAVPRSFTAALDPPPQPVAELITQVQRQGLRLFRHGTGGTWRSTRVRWPVPTPLDQRLDVEIVRLEKETRAAFFKEVHDAFSLQDLLPVTDVGEWSCDVHQVVKHRSARAVSVLHYIDSYTGGAHGGHVVVPLNLMDGPRGIELLTLPALFQPAADWRPGICRMVLEDLRSQGASSALPADPPQNPGPAPTLILGELQALKFTADATGIQIHFDPYEVGSSAEGRFVVDLPWATLRTWVRPEVVEAFSATPAPPGIQSRE